MNGINVGYYMQVYKYYSDGNEQEEWRSYCEGGTWYGGGASLKEDIQIRPHED